MKKSLKSGMNPSKWWHPKNMNKKFMLQYAEPEEFYVAIVDDKPAAAMILQNNERNQSWDSMDGKDKKKALYIHWLCVDRAFAGRKLPKHMVDFSINYAQEKGLKIVRVDTNAKEKKLKKLYESLGFKLVGTSKEDYRSTAFYQMRV